MRGTYHLRIRGVPSHEALARFLIEHKIVASFSMVTHSSVEDDMFDYLLDLTAVELMHVYLLCQIISCDLLKEPPGVLSEIVG